jgi:hypothetical protein
VVTASDGNLLASLLVNIYVQDLRGEGVAERPRHPGLLNLSDGRLARSVQASDRGMALIRWRADDLADGAAFYRLRRSPEDAGDFQIIVKKLRDNGPGDFDDRLGRLAYLDDTLEPGRSYEYGVRTFYDTGGKSKWTQRDSSHSSGNVVFTATEQSAVDSILGVFAPDILTGDRFTYELEGADAEYFRVDDKGQLRLRRTLDFATGDRYELAVIATDDRQQSAFLNVIVMDAAKASSDHDAGGKSKWTRRDLPHSSGNVVFTAKEHSAVDTILGVFAPDILTGGRVTYELEGADAGYFRVNDKGQFRLRRTLDFATGDRYLRLGHNCRRQPLRH